MKDVILLLPAEKNWEVWRLFLNGQSQKLGECNSPAEAQVPRQTVLALPVQHVYAVPLWVVNSDMTLFSEVIYLQLEKRGLTSKIREETVMDFTIVGQNQNQSLVLAGCLPNTLPDNYFSDQIESYHLSAQFYPLPANQFTFWKENGRIVLSVTHDNRLIYFQMLSANAFTPSVVHEIRCIHLQLETQGMIHSVVGATVWGGFDSEDLRSLGQIFGNHITYKPRPAPQLPVELFELTPYRAQLAQANKLQKQKNKTLVTSICAAYALVVVILCLQLIYLWAQNKHIESELNKIDPTVKLVKKAQDLWFGLEPAINPALYPVENLYRCTLPIPQEGLRLTLFTQEDGTKFSIEGESKDITLVTQFDEGLRKQNPDLQWSPLASTPQEETKSIHFAVSGSHLNAPVN